MTQAPPIVHRFENHPKKKQHHHRNRWKEESCDKNVIWSTNAVCILILAVIQLPICIGNNFVVKQIFVAKIILLTFLKYFEIHYIDEWYEWNVPGWAKKFSTDSRKMSYWIAWNLWKYLFHYSYQYLSHDLIQVHDFQKFISISFILDLVPDSARASAEFNGEYISFAQASFRSLGVP